MNDSNLNYYAEENFAESAIDKLIPLRPSEFIECTFTSIDFSQTNFALSKFIECKFTNCNLSNISLKNSLFRDCLFSSSKLIGLNFCETQGISTPRFFDSVLDYSVFQSLALAGSKFINCSMREVDFYEANLSKCDFSGSLLKGAVFYKANLSSSDFRGAYDYFIDLRETNVKKAKFNLPEALGLLTGLDITLE